MDTSANFLSNMVALNIGNVQSLKVMIHGVHILLIVMVRRTIGITAEISAVREIHLDTQLVYMTGSLVYTLGITRFGLSFIVIYDIIFFLCSIKMLTAEAIFEIS